MRITITDWIHKVLEGQIKEGDHCIDATMGKGGDTLFLCQRTGQSGKVTAFDVQKQALEMTIEKLEKHGVKAKLIQDGHEHMANYFALGTIQCIMFNLGYLPGGDHQLVTRPKTSIEAFEAGLRLLKVGGIMSICIYSGGDSGFEERDQVLDWLEELDDRTYFVIKEDFPTKKNHPPMPVFLVKLK